MILSIYCNKICWVEKKEEKVGKIIECIAIVLRHLSMRRTKNHFVCLGNRDT